MLHILVFFSHWNLQADRYWPGGSEMRWILWHKLLQQPLILKRAQIKSSNFPCWMLFKLGLSKVSSTKFIAFFEQTCSIALFSYSFLIKNYYWYKQNYKKCPMCPHIYNVLSELMHLFLPIRHNFKIKTACSFIKNTMSQTWDCPCMGNFVKAGYDNSSYIPCIAFISQYKSVLI